MKTKMLPLLTANEMLREEFLKPMGLTAYRLAKETLRRGLPTGVALNVNFPCARSGTYRGVSTARLGRRIYSSHISRRADPRGRHYYWLGGKGVKWIKAPGTDVNAVASGRVSVTPLHLDQTDTAMLETLRRWDF